MHTNLTTNPPPVAGPAKFDVRGGIWLLPVFGALIAWATFEHQPDPTSEFRSWSQFVTTDRFLASHLVGSILGQAVYLLGAVALAATVLPTTRRQREAVSGIVVAVLGSAGLLAGFGTAAFAQPAIGRLELAGGADARQLYDDVYATPAMITLLGGAALFAISTALLARAAAATGAARWATLAFGVSGPLIGIVGMAVGPAQTLGALAAIVGGTGLARTSAINPPSDHHNGMTTVNARPGSTDVPTWVRRWRWPDRLTTNHKLFSKQPPTWSMLLKDPIPRTDSSSGRVAENLPAGSVASASPNTW